MGTSGYPPEFLYYLIQAVQCLVYLAGFVAGILLLARKRTLPGILALVAYFLIGLGAIAYIIIWDIILPTTNYTGGYAWASLCLWTSMTLLGMIGLVAFAFASLGKKEKPLPPPMPPLDL
jgi:hypothetical protein